jgi:hypothetical protein
LSSNTFTPVADNPDASALNSFEWNFLVLPNGQILATETDSPNIWLYTPTGTPNKAWAPVITTFPTTINRSLIYQLKGTQFNGLTQGASYGDDVQGDTDRPIVKIVNNATGHVFYAPSLWYTVSLAANAASQTLFWAKSSTETGASTLYVVANGISSAGVAVTIQ